MNWRNILIQAAKQAVNAAIMTVTTMFAAPDSFNWHSKGGVEHMGAVIGMAVLSREAMVWGPKLLAWSQTPDDALQETKSTPISITHP